MRALARLIGGGIAGIGAVGVGYAGLAGQDETTRDQTGAVIESGDIGVFRIRVGDCLLGMPQGEIQSLNAVPCSQSHVEEVYGAFNLPGDSNATFPGTANIDRSAGDGCYAKFRPFVGIAYEDSIYDISYIAPTQLSWEQQHDHEVLCLISKHDGTHETGSARGAGQ